MADQLLSQADVDALVASLTKNEPPKPAPAPAKPAAAAPPPVSAPKPSPFSSTSSRPPSTPDFGNMTVVSNKSAAAPVSPAATASRPAPAPLAAGNESVAALNSKIAELTKQLNSVGAACKALEKRVADMEARAAKTNGATAELKIQQLTEEMKKIITNLKGTPGYGARNTFTCEKCDDHGHVAVQYRCTNCGSERWYGWWPEKKKK